MPGRDFIIKVEPEAKSIMFKLENFNQASLDAIHYRLVWGANRIRNRWINAMRRTPKTGKKYKRGGRWHIASSPGNAPAVDTGQYLRSIIMQDRIDEIEVGAKSGAPYAKYLETGTKREGKQVILPRPVMEPASNAEIPRIQERILYDLDRMKL
jgi:hypothetical protein